MCPNNLFIQVQEFPPLPPKPNSSQFPGLLADVFARVGGPDRADTAVQDSMITVDGDGVILDNVWLWRVVVQRTPSCVQSSGRARGTTVRARRDSSDERTQRHRKPPASSAQMESSAL